MLREHRIGIAEAVLKRVEPVFSSLNVYVCVCVCVNGMEQS